MRSRASETWASGLIVTSRSPVMTSATVVRPGSRRGATARTTTSRSVTIPCTRPSASTTGIEPTSCSAISRAT
jgi:hypothetical protein